MAGNNGHDAAGITGVGGHVRGNLRDVGDFDLGLRGDGVFVEAVGFVDFGLANGVGGYV